MIDVGVQLENEIKQRHEQEQTQDEVDLDDTIPALLLELGVEIFVASLILPHFFVWFIPRIRGIMKLNENSMD